MNTNLSLGIDIGSTTIKLVLINENHEILYKTYQRHFSEPTNALKQYFKEVLPFVEGKSFRVCMSGSAGMGLASRLEIPFEQEVLACTEAIRTLIPQTDTAIELGGEDAKITYLKGS